MTGRPVAVVTVENRVLETRPCDCMGTDRQAEVMENEYKHVSPLPPYVCNS